MRKRLEEVFRNVSLAHDVVAICIEVSESNSGDFDAEMAHVLRRCAVDKLCFRMEVLTKVIERLGGTTTQVTRNRSGRKDDSNPVRARIQAQTDHEGKETDKH